MTPHPLISRCLRILPAAVALVVTLIHAQTPPNPPDTSVPETIEAALHHMSDQAGVVFVGEVIAIRHREGENGTSGIVEVEFRIDQAVLGCTGSAYILREWAGLWSGGDQRYRIGQRLLMLLHAPGAAAITSPVGGMAGAIPIRGSSTAPRATDTVTSSAAAPVADLRWVGTHLLHPATYRTDSATLVTATSQPATPNVSDASTAAQQAPVNVVVDMLTSWQKAQHAVQ